MRPDCTRNRSPQASGSTSCLAAPADGLATCFAKLRASMEASGEAVTADRARLAIALRRDGDDQDGW